MPEGVAGRLAAAAALLLRAPDARTVGLLAGGPVDEEALAAARQDYWDVLCVPQSGRFVPPYEHVLRNAHRQGRLWFFPPARYDGGDDVARIFARFGFWPRRLDVEPIWAAPHLPADHLGFMLAFVAWGLGGLERARENEDRAMARAELGRFVSNHLGQWTALHAELLADRGGCFTSGVAQAVREAVEAAREATSAAPGEARGYSRAHANVRD